jgi:hypothetical protein
MAATSVPDSHTAKTARLLKACSRKGFFWVCGIINERMRGMVKVCRHTFIKTLVGHTPLGIGPTWSSPPSGMNPLRILSTRCNDMKVRNHLHTAPPTSRYQFNVASALYTISHRYLLLAATGRRSPRCRDRPCAGESRSQQPIGSW